MCSKWEYSIFFLVLVYAKTVLVQTTNDTTYATGVTKISTAVAQNSTEVTENAMGVTQNTIDLTQNATDVLNGPHMTQNDRKDDQNFVSNAFNSSQIVPNCIPVAPKIFANVTFVSGVEANLGAELTPTLVKDPPDVKWNGNPEQFYSLLMVDIDVPSRTKPALAELLHWQIVNIRGDNLTSGETTAAYIGAGPSKNSGLHRYVLLVFQQPSQLVFNVTKLNNRSTYKRIGFSTTAFTKKYNLSGPIAGNFFLAQYDSYVPILYKQLGIRVSGASKVEPFNLFVSLFVVWLCYQLYF